MGNSPAAEDKHSQPFVSLSFFFTAWSAVWSRKGEGPVVHKMEAVLFLTLFFFPQQVTYLKESYYLLLLLIFITFILSTSAVAQ